MEFDRSPKIVFDRAAQDYDAYRPRYPSTAIGAMIRLSALRPDSRLLEVGCGTGQATLPFAEMGYQIDAVELGPNLAAIMAAKFRRWPRAFASMQELLKHSNPRPHTMI